MAGGVTVEWRYDELCIRVHAERMGDGLCVTVCGGDRPHIGSTAIAEPRPSLTGDGSVSATVSVYNCVGHKDGEVTERLAMLLSSRLNRRTVVVCGIHYDAVSAALLADVRDWIDRAADDIAAAVG